ncbi:MAG TPA: hypothetical protein PLT76_08190, partial [Candidatus Omnitrophota bacterium]|nr:hypothetical protein [Candidatus Omnitrophota bacterium]
MNKMIREIICVKICPFLIALILFSFSVGITVKADESDIIPEDPSSPVGTYSSDSAVSTYRGLILYPPVKQKGKGKGKKITQITPLSGGSTTLDLNCPPPNWVSVPGAGTPDEFYKVINWLDLNTSSLTNFAKSFWYFPEQNSDPGYCILSHTNEPAAWAIINFGTNAYDHANGLILRMLSMREEQNTTTCLAMETLKGDECRNIELRAWGMCDGTDPAHPYIYGDNAIPGVTCTGTDSPASIDQVNYYLFKATNADCDYSFPPSEPFVPPNWVDWFPISGENAWVAIAAVHYYDLTGDTIALDVAKKAADGAILLQVTAPGIAQGGIRMAPEGTYHEPQNPSWYDIISTENNLSWYAAFRMLYEKTDDEKYQNALMGIEQYLQAAFDPSDVDGNPVNGFQPGFVQGMNFEQGNWIKARKFATDCQTWAIDVLGAQEIDDWFGEETAMNIWRSTKTLAGVYDGGNLQGVDFTDYNRTDLNRAPMISYEWTGGAILATYLLDQYYRNQHPAWADEAQVDENTMKNYTLEDAFSVEGEAIRIEDYYEPGMASPVDIIAWPYASGSGNMINRPTGHGWYAPSREVKSLASTAWMSYINREPPFNPFYLGIPSGGAPPETNIGTPRFKTIDGGKNHSIAVKQNGSVWTWGNNSKGQIGDGSVTESLIPKQVIINGYGKEVTATNESSYVLLGDGTVKSWGNNNYGQLGDGTTVGYSTTPVNVLLPSGIISIAGGYNHMLALRDDGTVWAWGRNDGGQLGVEPSQHKNIPIQVPGLDHIKAIAAGTEHSVALKEDGTVWTWGTNHYGQLGRTNTYPYIPARVPCLTSIKNIASSLRHVLALSIDGTVWGWGLNQYNQLGLDEAYPDSSRNIPIKIPNINNVKEIAAGAYHSLFLLNDGTVVSKGGHPNFEVGDPASLSQITDIGCGLYHSFAIHNNGSLWAWGYNQEGQIGNGEKGNVKATPVQVPHFNFWQALLQTIDGGVGHTIALKQDKTIWTWGLNSYGQLGDGTLVDRYNPTQITGLGLGKEVAATHKSTYALLEDGTVWAWGWNQFG